MGMEQLDALIADLQEKLRSRIPVARRVRLFPGSFLRKLLEQLVLLSGVSTASTFPFSGGTDRLFRNRTLAFSVRFGVKSGGQKKL